MKEPVAFRHGNLMWIRVTTGSFTSGSEPKYIAVIPYSGILPDNILTLAEIKRKYPTATELDDITKG